MEIKRCPECGSWEAECGSVMPVSGCGCARCLQAEVARLRKALKDYGWHMKFCPAAYHDEPCICGFAKVKEGLTNA